MGIDDRPDCRRNRLLLFIGVGVVPQQEARVQRIVFRLKMSDRRKHQRVQRIVCSAQIGELRIATPTRRHQRVQHRVGRAGVHVFVAVLTVAGIALTFAYRPPANAAVAAGASSRPGLRALIAVSVAGTIWGLFNVGFAIIFSFGPTMVGSLERTNSIRPEIHPSSIG